MFNCDEVIQLLTDYVDGELEPGDQAQLDRHFNGCPSCDNFLKSFKMTIELTGEYKCEDIPDSVSRKLHDFLEARIREMDAGQST